MTKKTKAEARAAYEKARELFAVGDKTLTQVLAEADIDAGTWYHHKKKDAGLSHYKTKAKKHKLTKILPLAKEVKPKYLEIPLREETASNITVLVVPLKNLRTVLENL